MPAHQFHASSFVQPSPHPITIGLCLYSYVPIISLTILTFKFVTMANSMDRLRPNLWPLKASYPKFTTILGQQKAQTCFKNESSLILLHQKVICKLKSHWFQTKKKGGNKKVNTDRIVSQSHFLLRMRITRSNYERQQIGDQGIFRTNPSNDSP